MPILIDTSWTHLVSDAEDVDHDAGRIEKLFGVFGNVADLVAEKFVEIVEPGNLDEFLDHSVTQWIRDAQRLQLR